MTTTGADLLLFERLRPQFAAVGLTVGEALGVWHYMTVDGLTWTEARKKIREVMDAAEKGVAES